MYTRKEIKIGLSLLFMGMVTLGIVFVRCSSPKSDSSSLNTLNSMKNCELTDTLSDLTKSASDENSEPDELNSILKRLEEIDFYLVNESGSIDTGITSLSLGEYPYLTEKVVQEYNGTFYNSMHVKKRNPPGGNLFPDFHILRYQFKSDTEARIFFTEVLFKLQKNDLVDKAPYVYVLSGRNCFSVWTRAHMFYYDFMPQILDCIDPKSERVAHLL